MYQYGQRTQSLPPVVKNILIINVLVFLAQTLLPVNVRSWIDLTFSLHFPHGGNFNILQPVTYMFMHANLTHIFCNMFSLWMFGRILEYDLGSRRFLVYYLVCGIGAGLIQIGTYYIDYMSLLGSYRPELLAAWASEVHTMGASGAVFGLLLAFGMIHPNSQLMLLFPPIPIRAKWFVIGYGVLELIFGVSGGGSGVAHFAHLGGMLWGLIMLIYWKRRGDLYY